MLIAVGSVPVILCCSGTSRLRNIARSVLMFLKGKYRTHFTTVVCCTGMISNATDSSIGRRDPRRLSARSFNIS
jgi:hypothetical protein